MKLKAFLGLGKGEQNLPSELLIKNELVEGEAAKRAWRDAFQKLGEVNEKDSDFDEQFLKECKDQIENWIEQKQESIELDREIGREEVLRAVKALKAGKAAGYDGTTGEILKQGGDDLIDLTWSLLREIFEAETIPSDWSKGLIFPLFKGGERKNLGTIIAGSIC